MPGYIIHLVEAKMIVEKLITHLKCEGIEEWKKMFYYGCLMPDAVGKSKAITHFWNKEEESKIVRTPNLNDFIKELSPRLNEPIVMGYLAHLHLDKMFFEEFLMRYVVFLDENNNETTSIKKVKSVFLKIKNMKIDIKAFFSEEYLYGDYTKLNTYFVEKYNVDIGMYYADRMNCKIGIVDTDDLDIIINEKLKNFILQGKIQESGALKVFNKKGDDVEMFLKQAAEEFSKWMID